MKICPKCSVEHAKPGTFCSRSCANGRIHTPETIKKIVDGMNKARTSKPLTEKQLAHVKSISALAKQKCREQKMALPFEQRGKAMIKALLFEEQSGKCLHCDLDVWLDKPITLELDHIDGNSSNNVRENVRLLCPNCHAQTPTWRRAKSHPAWKVVPPAGIEPASEV